MEEKSKALKDFLKQFKDKFYQHRQVRTIYEDLSSFAYGIENYWKEKVKAKDNLLEAEMKLKECELAEKDEKITLLKEVVRGLESGQVEMEKKHFAEVEKLKIKLSLITEQRDKYEKYIFGEVGEYTCPNCYDAKPVKIETKSKLQIAGSLSNED